MPERDTRLRSIGALHPTFEEWGGAEWFLHQMLQRLTRDEGIHCVLYTHRWADPPGEAPAYQVVTHRMGGMETSPWDWARIARRLGASWRDHEAILASNFPATVWYARACAAGPMPHAVWYCHEPSAMLYPPFADESAKTRPPRRAPRLGSLSFYRASAPWWAYSRLRRGLARRAAGGEAWTARLRTADAEAVARIGTLAANSAYTAGRVRTIYGREARIVHPVPPDLPDFARPSPHDPPERRDVLFVGRLSTAKRPSMLLDAWERACALEPRARGHPLVFVGDGPLGPALRARIAQSPLGPSVRLLSGLSRPELIAQYRRSVLTVHLGLAEPFGLVVLESLAAGTPVLAEWDGGVPEILEDGRTGWAFRGGDVDALARRLADIPSSLPDLRAMGERAILHVAAAFDSARTGRAIADLLEHAAGSRSAPRESTSPAAPAAPVTSGE